MALLARAFSYIQCGEDHETCIRRQQIDFVFSDIFVANLGGQSASIRSGESVDVSPNAYPRPGGNRENEHAPALPEIVTFSPSHFEKNLNPQPPDFYDIPQFYADILGAVHSISDKNTNGNPKDARAIQRFFDGISGTARAEQFRKELQRPLDVLAYLGHSIEWIQPERLPEAQFSYGLTFYYPTGGPWDVNGQLTSDGLNPGWGDKLVPMEKDRNTVTGLGLTENYSIVGDWDFQNSQIVRDHPSLLLINTLAPQAKIMFFSACSLNPSFGGPEQVPPFVQMWDVHDLSTDGAAENRVRAMVVPVYPPNRNKPDNVLFYLGAKEWKFVLYKLVRGANIADAVSYANSQIILDPVYQGTPDAQGLSWKVLGNHGVKLSWNTDLN